MGKRKKELSHAARGVIRKFPLRFDTMCGNLVEKNRYRIPAAEPGLAWEVDEYFGANAPLVTAEIELPDENTIVTLPDWIGLEVTDDHRYKNNNLAVHPFSEWREGSV